MPRFLYLLLFFILPFNSFSQKRILLDWDFFKNDKSSTAEFDSYIQHTLAYRYGIVSTKGNQLNIRFETKVVLDTAKSYFDFKKKGNDYKQLHHLQGHADIATIYAIKLKSILSKGKYLKGNHHAQIKEMYNGLFSQMDKEHKRYSEETNRGLIDSVQTKWDLYFKKELHIK